MLVFCSVLTCRMSLRCAGGGAYPSLIDRRGWNDLKGGVTCHLLPSFAGARDGGTDLSFWDPQIIWILDEYKTNNHKIIIPKRLFSSVWTGRTTAAVKIGRSDPFEDGFTALLFPHVKFLDQIQAGQDISDIIQASYLSWTNTNEWQIEIVSYT